MSLSQLAETPAAADRSALSAWWRQRRAVAAQAQLPTGDDDDPLVHLVGKGWVAQVRQMADGERQILRLLLPGDVGGLRPSRISTLVALTDCEVASLPWSQVRSACDVDPELAATLAAVRRREDASREEWMVSLGSRRAPGRAAHLLCELFVRQDGREDTPCDLPLTQRDWAEALGLSVVHVNRVLQGLRRKGLLKISRGHVTLHDFAALAELAAFDRAYLD